MRSSAKPSSKPISRPQAMPLYWAGLVLILPLILLAGVFVPRIRQGMLHRLGLSRFRLPNQGILIVASSVGEVGAAERLAPYLRRAFAGYYLVLCAFSYAGFRRGLQGGFFDGVLITPYDLPVCIRSCLAKFRPRALIQIESDIWPTLTLWARERKALTALAGGRMTEGALHRLIPFGGITRAMYRMMDVLTARFGDDATLVRRLSGGDVDVRIIGNLKYSDIASIPVKRDTTFAGELGVSANRKLIVAGSTHRGEERMIFTAYLRLLEEFPRLGLVVAPRYVSRGGEVATLAQSMGLRTVRRSHLLDMRDLDRKDWQVLVLDTLGELSRAYTLADVAVVGGGFGGRGGQDMVQPAARGVPVLFGPKVPTFRYEAEKLNGCGGFVVADALEMAEVLGALIKNPAYRKRVAGQARRTALGLAGAGEAFMEELGGWNLKG